MKATSQPPPKPSLLPSGLPTAIIPAQPQTDLAPRNVPHATRPCLPHRQSLARARLDAARAALDQCQLCSHRCAVNRNNGELGRCGAGPLPRYFSAQTEVSDELSLVPVFAIAFSGCDLRCDFCITGASSWNPKAGVPASLPLLAERASRALGAGARSIMMLGGEPTVHLPAALELVSLLPERAYLTWKTNAHGTAQARELLKGLFDAWVADFKFGNDRCAQRLAQAEDYTQRVRENLLWAHAHTRLIVRHLLMPGHARCCWQPVAAWLAEHLPAAEVNLRSGFWPAWRAARHPEMRGTVSASEAAWACRCAAEYGLSLVE